MTSGTVTRKDIGGRIAAARKLQRWGQADLAEAMREATGDDVWTYYRISKVERGEKTVEAEMLPIFAQIQGQSIEWYYTPLPSYTAPPAASVAKGPYLNTGRSASITRLRPRLEVVPSQEASDTEGTVKRAA